MGNRAKVITICGSLKFVNEIMMHSKRLELEGNCVLNIIYSMQRDKDDYTEEQFEILDRMHKQKIDMSDAIFVINVGGYIGEGTKSEIEYAAKLDKEIIYLEEQNRN
ncbi:MAG: hypothetical protein N4A47_06935 [Clostridia bacterium]|jgi:hypothetical protein|nr:hypothetical protein [Clostridia bacterium]